jgi:hypothetical protein
LRSIITIMEALEVLLLSVGVVGTAIGPPA